MGTGVRGYSKKSNVEQKNKLTIEKSATVKHKASCNDNQPHKMDVFLVLLYGGVIGKKKAQTVHQKAPPAPLVCHVTEQPPNVENRTT